jgi:hypothetical protein
MHFFKKHEYAASSEINFIHVCVLFIIELSTNLFTVLKTG